MNSENPQQKKKNNVVVGLDLSLTATGIVVLKGSEIVEQKVARSKPEGDTPTYEIIRIINLVAEIMETIDEFEPSLVTIEGMAFMAKNTSALVQLSALNYMVRQELFNNGIDFIIVAPSTLKKFITGKGNAQKDQMMLEIYKKYGHSFLDNNIADAFALAQCAYLINNKIDGSNEQEREVIALLCKQLEK